VSCSFHPEARRELFEAVLYYDGIDLRLGNQFIQAVERTIDRIEQFPEAWASLSLNSRRCRVSNFPYGVVYQIMDNTITIVAVMHLHRKPDYWADRTLEL
jgi:mRNA-degrading endonuclease RelE of RelBE toxin-antitoxin system